MLQTSPLFSVLIPAYNASVTIEETLRSCLAQTLSDLEVVVTDDGSTDDTAAIIERIAAEDARVRLVRQANGGTGSALNAAGAAARGRWHIFLGADDLLLPEYLEHQLAFIEQHPGFDIYSCNAWFQFPDGQRQPMWTGPKFDAVFSLTPEDQIMESSIVAMAVFSPRIWELTGGHRTIRHAEDYDLWLRALLLGARHIYNPEILAVYRRSPGQKSRQLVVNAKGFLKVRRDAVAMPEITDAQRALLQERVRFTELLVGRRELEEKLLAGDTSGARAMYWRYRGAFPDKLKFCVGLGIMLLSPRAYARIKVSRMV